MAATWRRRILAVLVLVLLLPAVGCNLLALPFFIFGPDPKIDPVLKRIAPGDKERDVKIVVLAYSSSIDVRPELLKADRDIANLTTRYLKKGFEYNKERVTIVNQTKVEEYKNNHPGWQTMDRAEIGRHFGADYVVYMEINELSLYEPRSANQLYRGKASISVNLVDCTDPDADEEQREFTCMFPKESFGPIPVEDKPLSAFKLEFFGSVALQLSWYFTSHPTRDEFKLN
jgi:hypothetical protein